MPLKVYKVSELIAAGKAVARSIPKVGSEFGKDLDLTINAAARLFQGVQVAATHVYEQIVPRTADATRRDEMIDELGLKFEREAAPARGLIAFFSLNANATTARIPAGTIVDFPGTSFADGQARSYRTLEEAVNSAAATFDPPMELGIGTGIHKLVINHRDGVTKIKDRALLVLSSNSSAAEPTAARTRLAIVRTSNRDDQSLDLYTPVPGTIRPTSAFFLDRVGGFVNNMVVRAECVTPGAAGNAPRVYHYQPDFTVSFDAPAAPIEIGLGKLIVEMSGGGDAVGPIDSDTGRVVRMLEDTYAMPPSHGNLQHWREIALACPDVDLDDVVIYQHVRAPGTLDIVCIGRSGGLRSIAFPDASLGFVWGGNNTRLIGDTQAERVQQWLDTQTGYFEDIRVRTMEWDWRGNSLLKPVADLSGLADVQDFLQSSSGVVLEVEPLLGYGPDNDKPLDIRPAIRHSAKLYPAALGAALDPSIKAGQRVWVSVGPKDVDLAGGLLDTRHPFTTIVTEVLSVTAGYATIADVSKLVPGTVAPYGGELAVFRWGSAGPLTQPVLDATFAYYDGLGPGSYSEVPRGPNYALHFGDGDGAPTKGYGPMRWPPEGRRWNSSVRESELRAAVMAVTGVGAVKVYPVGDPNGVIDFEPAMFRTCALTGVVPAYGVPDDA